MNYKSLNYKKLDLKNFVSNLSKTTNNYPWLLVAWLVYGALLGIAGIFVSGGHIPVFVLGCLFGLVGGLFHLAIVTLKLKPFFVIVGFIITIAASLLTVLWAPIQIWSYAIASYFIFGSLYYLLLEKLFLPARN